MKINKVCRFKSLHASTIDIFLLRDYLKVEVIKEGKVMAQRRAEKPKKMKISPKQKEFYNRLRFFKR